MAGDEYSAEFGWCSLAGWVLIGYTKKIKSPEPTFVELAHIFPYSFGNGLDDDICQTLIGCLQALGLKNCVAHVEFKLHQGQVFVVEINPRLAGDMIVDLVRTACGVDMGKIAYLSHTGTPWAADLAINHTCHAATAYLYSEQTGTVMTVRTDGSEQDLWLRPLPRYNTGNLTSSDDRLGCVIATADTWQSALQKTQHIADTTVISFGEI
ncbi:ATP-grasp domain-containing protein [Moraxella cuniculi]|uniref:ATP-grasp domain-containing protein n=1 Tax=Moraxella cuniculi TaxID=34061 RepID=UPI000F8312EB|nr:ATP-grasp domain-containing protein [Moraxella cuniculi]